MKARLLVVPAAALATVLLLAACGGGSSAGGGGGATAGDFCTLAKSAATDQKPTLKFDEATTLTDIQTQFNAYAKAVDAMDGAAPGSIATPMHGYRAMVDTANTTTQAASSATDTFNAFASLLQVVPGGKTVDSYTQQNCGVTLNIGAAEDLQNLASPSPS